MANELYPLTVSPFWFVSLLLLLWYIFRKECWITSFLSIIHFGMNLTTLCPEWRRWGQRAGGLHWRPGLSCSRGSPHVQVGTVHSSPSGTRLWCRNMTILIYSASRSLQYFMRKSLTTCLGRQHPIVSGVFLVFCFVVVFLTVLSLELHAC